MVKTKNATEDDIESVINEWEYDGWQFVTAVQTSAKLFYAEPIPRYFPATYLLFFRKSK